MVRAVATGQYGVDFLLPGFDSWDWVRSGGSSASGYYTSITYTRAREMATFDKFAPTSDIYTGITFGRLGGSGMFEITDIRVYASELLGMLANGKSEQAAAYIFKGKDFIRGSGSADKLSGYANNDQLKGKGGNDMLNGDRGRDRLDGGTGDDTLYGGLGGDRFVFKRGYDRDVVMDFDDARDKLDLRSFDFTSVKQVKAKAEMIAGDTVFKFGDGDRLVLDSFKLKWLDADDFML